VVGETDLADLVPLVVDYCAFYETAPSAEALERLSRTLIDHPDREGLQLIAREEPDAGSGAGAAIGFATVYWTWSTTTASRLAVMNDLFVVPHARGSGAAQALIAACAEQARAHGAAELQWVTAPDNARAQAVYDRTAAERESWITYVLPVSGVYVSVSAQPGQ
jgi:GNAT superfamily N-acetyltransferase